MGVNAIDDIALAQEQSNSGQSNMADILTAIDKFFNKENIEQKSRLTRRNIRGIMRVRGTNEYFMRKFGVKNDILETLVDCRIVLSISEKGKGREEMIEMVKSMNGGIQNEQQISMLMQGLGKRI